MSTQTKKTVRATLEIDQQELLDIASTAIEGGIGYWSFIENYDFNNPNNLGTLSPTEDEDEFVPTILTTNIVLRGIKKILKGDVKISKDIRQRLLLGIVQNDMGEIDAEVADCIVQVGMFNQITYG